MDGDIGRYVGDNEMLISPTEPPRIRELGDSNSLPEKYGADILVVGRRGRLGIQRKSFPNDFIASLADGRLYTQLHQMKELDQGVVLLEGLGKWTLDGDLVEMPNFTRDSFYSMLWSISFKFQMEVFQVTSIRETITALTSLERWWLKETHSSFDRRPGPQKSGWGRVTNKDYALHLLQSFPGVGVVQAERIYEHFGGVPLEWTVGEDDLMEVGGIGKGRAKRLIDVLTRRSDEGQGASEGTNTGAVEEAADS
jgi:ERCC4-type nuclease